MKQLFTLISFGILGFGIYLGVFYDVPDSAQQMNFFMSWLLSIVGVAGVLIGLFWSEQHSSKNLHHNDQSHD